MRKAFFLILFVLAGHSSAFAQSTYKTQNILGWTVHIQDSLITLQPELMNEVVSALSHSLFDIRRVAPEAALAKLQSFPIWLSVTGTRAYAEYHPNADWLKQNGHDPRKAGGIEFADMKILRNALNFHPWCVLELLGFGYSHKYLTEPQRRRLLELHSKASAKKLYQNVLDFQGNTGAAPTLTTPESYFSESISSYLGLNNTYPFNRPELRDFDPDIYVFMIELIGSKW